MSKVKIALDYLRRGQIMSGLRNCHLPNLHSIVLEGRSDYSKGMLRIFYTTKGCPIETLYNENDEKRDFSLMPHNHRQNIRLYKLFGRIENYNVDLGFYSHFQVTKDLYQYSFRSAILEGVAGVVLDCKVPRFSIANPTQLRHDEPLSLPYSQVHTVVAKDAHSVGGCNSLGRDIPAAWLVEEGELAPEKFEPMCYSTSDQKELDTSYLYQPMDHGELQDAGRSLLYWYGQYWMNKSRAELAKKGAL